MGQTHKMEVVAVNGDTLSAKLSIVSVDEAFLWISPAFFACQLHESTARGDKAKGQPTRDALMEAGFFSEQDAEDDDDGLARFNEKAAAFIASVEIGEMKNARIVGRREGAALRVARNQPKQNPTIDVTIRVTDAKYLQHLKKGTSWETAPMGFGAFPEED